MKTVAPDKSQKLDLSTIDEVVEVRDDSGEVIGYYAPTSFEHWKMVLRALVTIDRERIEEIKRNPGKGMTTPELQAWLETLEVPDGCATR